MEVIKVTPRGYCKGVIHAISIAKQTVLEYPDKNIYVLGMLVHNRYVMDLMEWKMMSTPLLLPVWALRQLNIF